MDKASLRNKAQIPQFTTAFSYIRIISQNHPAFTCRNVFIRIKTESANITKTSTFLALILQTNGFGCVLNNFNIMLLRYFIDGTHINRETINMDNHNSHCTGSNLSFDFRNIHIPGIGIRINDNWDCAGPNYSLSTRNYGEGWQNHFISFLYAQSSNGNI